jgi:hypothetical protein
MTWDWEHQVRIPPPWEKDRPGNPRRGLTKVEWFAQYADAWKIAFAEAFAQHWGDYGRSLGYFDRPKVLWPK